MEPKPVQENQSPRYPTRREVLAGAASLVAVNLAGGLTFAEAAAAGVTVAPIFQHGEGRGATGCVVVSPPVFLSEEEAMQIIREELAKHGVKLKDAMTLKDVRVPKRRWRIEFVKKPDGTNDVKSTVEEVDKDATPLKLDGADSDTKVAVKFVSQQDYHELGGVASVSTVQGYDFKKVAEYAAAQLKKQGKDPMIVGFFYDPSPQPSKVNASIADNEKEWRLAWVEAQRKGRAESKELLRQQAQDFAAWLKKEKVIP